MISGSNEQLQQELEYTQPKPDCHNWWISKMQSGREDTWGRTICNKIPWYKLSGIKDQKKTGNLWGMMRGVGGVRKSIHQSWLAKRLGLGLLCWGFKGVQQEIPREEASTLQIGSVAFPPRQCTSSQLNPCHRLFHQDGHQDSSPPSL